MDLLRHHLDYAASDLFARLSARLRDQVIFSLMDHQYTARPTSSSRLVSEPGQQILQPLRHGLHSHGGEQQPEDSGGDVESRESESLGD